MKALTILSIIGPLTITLVACGGGNSDGMAPPDGSPTPTAKITVSRVGAATGAVNGQEGAIECGDSCSAIVAVGTVITLTATADTGATFGGWSGGGCSGSAGTCSITVSEDVTVAAQFDVAMFVVDLRPVGSGTGIVDSHPTERSCHGACAIAVAYNTTVELVAAAGAGSSFMGWGGPCTGTGVCSFTVTASVTVTAAFAAKNDLIVMLAGNGNGTVSSHPDGIECGADCAQRYTPGTVVKLWAVTAADSIFAGWSGEGCAGTGICEVTMAGAALVTATFGLQQHELAVAIAGTGSGTVSSSPEGIACGADCSERFDAHTAVTLTAAAAADSTFAGWSGGGCAGTAACTVTIESAISVTATFSLLLPPAASTGLYTINDATQHLEHIDTATLAITDVGSLGVAYSLGDCTWDPGQSKLYFIDGGANNALYTVSRATGAATLVGVHGITNLSAIAYHPPTQKLYGMDWDDNSKLYEMNLMNGTATLIGSTGADRIDGMAWDSARNTMVALSSSSPAVLYSLDLSSGAATVIRSGLDIAESGLTYDPIIDRFWAVDAQGRFIQIDPNAGNAVTTLATGLEAHSCLAFIPPAP